MQSLILLTLWLSIMDTIIMFIPKYEYVFSLKKDVIMNSEKNGINFYNSFGDVLINDQTVRLVPSMENKKGLIVTKRKIFFDWWEVVIDAHISGSHSIGADGMAFWYRKDIPKLGGVFGASDKWVGLGIMFDTFNNDNEGANPQIVAILNNATFLYDHDSDGKSQIYAGCQLDFRNTLFRVRIRYFNNKLTMWFKSMDDNTKEEIKPPNIEATSMDPTYGYICFNKQDVYLPKNGYFGISAMTGDFGDDHDIHNMATFSIRPGVDISSMVTTEEDKVLEREKAQYDKLFKEKEKQHDTKTQINGATNQGVIEDQYTQSLHIIKSQQNMLLSKFDVFDAKFNNHLLKNDIYTPNNKAIQHAVKNQLNDKADYVFDFVNKQFDNILTKITETEEQVKMVKLHTNKCNSTCLSTNVFFMILLLQFIVMLGFIFIQLNRNSRAKKLY